jgi:hypothetical protein
MPFTDWSTGDLITATKLDNDNTVSVGTDTARTISVTHTWSASQTFTGGWTAAAVCTITQATANAAILTSTGYSLTGSDATTMVSLAGTWNTSGTPTALKIAITDTASNAASKLIDLLAGAAGATSIFSVTRGGLITVGGNSVFRWGTSTSEPRISRSSTTVQIELADASDWGKFSTGALTMQRDASGGGLLLTVASTTANAGLRLPHGTAPTSPTDGDMWTTTAGLYVRVNGVTVGPLT